MPKNYITTAEARAYDANDLGPAFAVLRDLAEGYTQTRHDLLDSLMNLIKVAEVEIGRLNNNAEYIPETFGIVQIRSLATAVSDSANNLKTIMELSRSARYIVIAVSPIETKDSKKD